MAVTATPALPQNPKRYGVQISTGTGTGQATIAVGGSNGTKITSVIASQSDTSPHNVTLGVLNGGITCPLGTILVSSQAGQVTAVPPANLLDPTVITGLPIDNDGQSYLFLTSSLDSLVVSSSTAVGAGATISINAFGADF